MNRATPSIVARGLGKDFGPVRALRSLDLTVQRGEFFGFLGPNGAGKTTTIHLLATLLRPSRGEAQVEGHDVVREPFTVRRKIGLVFQETTLDRDLTAEQNLAFAARLYGLDGRTARRRIGELLDLFELGERRGELVRNFSGGMRRALDIARGLLHSPSLLFLDEPTLGLDPANRRRTWEFLHRLRKSQSMTFFLTTHYLEEAEGCDRLAILHCGELLALGTPGELKGGSTLDDAFIALTGGTPEREMGNASELGVVGTAGVRQGGKESAQAPTQEFPGYGARRYGEPRRYGEG